MGVDNTIMVINENQINRYFFLMSPTAIKRESNRNGESKKGNNLWRYNIFQFLFSKVNIITGFSMWSSMLKRDRK